MVLKPVIPPLGIEHTLERELNAWFAEVVFQPLLELLDMEERLNARPNPLFAALESGRIQYANQMFVGSFSAAISRELRRFGATWDERQRGYRLPTWKVAYELRGAIANAKGRSAELHQRIVNLSATIGENLSKSPTAGLKLGEVMNELIDRLNRQFMESTKPVRDPKSDALEAITVPMQVTQQVRQELTETLTRNLELSVKGFTEQQMVELRKLAEQNLAEGGRVDRLAAIVKARFGVSKRKAAFLARQETSLIASKFTEARFKEIGSTSYVWYCRHDDRVRHDHQVLNGRTFSWSNPPIVDRATGKQANPGEDFNCRCVARPIINLQAA